MPKISIYLALAFAVLALTIGMGIGYALTPQYRLSMYEKNDMDLGPSDRWLDLRYLNAMISHHRGAMQLAEQAVAKSQRTEIKELANAILTEEPKAIAELYAWKQAWYQDKRRVKDPLPVHLGNYDDNYDLRFLNALIAHHQSGLLMTEEVRLKSYRAEVLDNADAVESFLRSTLPTLIEWRKNWYQV